MNHGKLYSTPRIHRVTVIREAGVLDVFTGQTWMADYGDGPILHAYGYRDDSDYLGQHGLFAAVVVERSKGRAVVDGLGWADDGSRVWERWVIESVGYTNDG